MSNEYQALQRDVTELIKKVGTRGKIRMSTGATASGYVVPVNEVQRDRDDTTERRNTKTLYFQGRLSSDPQTGDIVTVGKVDYAVITSERYTPDAKTNITWKLEVTS